jgi:hypothetical protein
MYAIDINMYMPNVCYRRAAAVDPPAKKKRGRKKKSQLLIAHQTEQADLVSKLENLELQTNLGFEVRDLLLIGVALDAQVSSLQEMFELFAPDVFRAMRQ